MATTTSTALSAADRRLHDVACMATYRRVMSTSDVDALRLGDASVEQRIAQLEQALLPVQPTDLSLECVRTECMLQLRKQFKCHVVAVTGRPPANEAFNAWLFVQLARSHHAGLPEGEQLFVPLAPLPNGSAESGGVAWPLVKYLLRARDRAAETPHTDDAAVEEQAVACDAWLRQQWQEAREKILSEAARHAEAAAASEELKVRGKAVEDGGWSVSLEPAWPRQRTEHRINASCLAKLRSGYNGPESEWDRRLFWLLHRYACIFGPSGEKRQGGEL